MFSRDHLSSQQNLQVKSGGGGLSLTLNDVWINTAKHRNVCQTENIQTAISVFAFLCPQWEVINQARIIIDLEA